MSRRTLQFQQKYFEQAQALFGKTNGVKQWDTAESCLNCPPTPRLTFSEELLVEDENYTPSLGRRL